MTTQYSHRLICVVPAGAKTNAISAWVVANVDATLLNPPGPGLSATGLTPATHWWWDASYTDAQCKAILVKLCQLAGVTPPTNTQWNGWTQAQKISWLKSVRAAILSGHGVWVSLCDNTAAAWDSPDGELTAMGSGLKRIVTPPP